MTYINCFISGVPYAKLKSRGDKEAPKRWSRAIKEQTSDLPRVRHACFINVTFLLPPDKFPTDLPYGPDLDNLLKRFLDDLKETLFANAAGGDSCIVSITAAKVKVDSPAKSGAHLEIFPIQTT